LEIPTEVISELTGSLLLITIGVDIGGVNGFSEFISERLGLKVNSVMLVGGLSDDISVGFTNDTFAKLDNGLTDSDGGTLHVIISQILEADFQVQLTGTGNNVLTSSSSETLDERIRLSETLETFHEFGEIGGVTALDGDADDGGDGVLHGDEVVSVRASGDGTRLEEVGINTNETDGVTTRARGKLLNVTTHHEDGTLDLLDVQVGLLTGDVIGTLDTDSLTSADDTGEDTTEGVETSLFRGGDHFGDVHHKRTFGVTVTDGLGGIIIKRSGVQVLNTVFLGEDGRRQVVDNHFQESLGSGKPGLHATLEERLSGEFTGILGDDDFELGQQLGVDIDLVVHDGIEESINGLHDELNETTDHDVTLLVHGALGPLTVLGVVKVITPELGHHLFERDTELRGIHLTELANGETPSMETRTESNSSFFRVNLDVTEEIVVVSGNDNIDRFNGAAKTLVGFFTFHVKLQEDAVELVNEENGSDTLRNGLTQDSLGLDANTFDAVDNDEGTISDTEGSSDFRGEINVTGRVNKVDQETFLFVITTAFVGVFEDEFGGILFVFLSLLSLLSLLLLTSSLGELLLVLGKSLLLLQAKIKDLDFLLLDLEVKRDTSRLDGNGTVLLILTGVHETSVTGLSSGNDTSMGNQRIGQGRFTVIDMSNN